MIEKCGGDQSHIYIYIYIYIYTVQWNKKFANSSRTVHDDLLALLAHKTIVNVAIPKRIIRK